MSSPRARMGLTWVWPALAALVLFPAGMGARRIDQPAPDPGPCAITTPGRVVAVGDVHGAFDAFVAILREAGLIDGRRRWSGGTATLVQLGDVLDRGPASKPVLDLLRNLEKEAVRAGGRVHFLVGNHEVMRMQGDLRYVSAGEYAVFRSPDAGDLRDSLYRAVVERQRAQAAAAGVEFDESAQRRKFYDESPLGIVELLRAFLPTGEYGRWLRAHGLLVRINGVVFLHGGLSPAVAAMGCAALEARTRAEIASVAPAQATDEALIYQPDGPLWYRGLVDGTATPEEIARLADDFGARAIVVGHTGSPGFRIASLWGGRVFAIDTGMLAGDFYPGGVASAIEFRGDVVTAVYQGRRERLGSLVDRLR